MALVDRVLVRIAVSGAIWALVVKTVALWRRTLRGLSDAWCGEIGESGQPFAMSACESLSDSAAEVQKTPLAV